MGREEVTVGFGRPEYEPFQAQPAQIIGHLAGGVLLAGDSEQRNNVLTEIAVVKAVDEMLKQRQRYQQSHHAGLAEFQCRRFLTILGDGGLHHALDAVAAQAAIVADAFDFQQAPIDLPPDLLQVRQIGQAFVHSKVVRVAESSFPSGSRALL